MKFSSTKIPDIIICEPTILGDDRGYFTETFRQDLLEEFLDLNLHFCQDNESKSSFGVLRGLHYQLPPFAQTKLIRVLKGAILDVAVDIRRGSPSFGEHISQELSAENRKQLFVPKGFAHGFVVLSEEAVVAYKVDHYYNQAADRGMAYDDKTLAIDWQLPKEALQLSPKDTQQPSFDSAEHFEYKIKLYA